LQVSTECAYSLGEKDTLRAVVWGGF